MSQFSTLTTRERKMQAAAICREIQGPGDPMDLGKKMSVPKDVMLEELSLTSNRGSLLFKRRQKRSEKYTFESIQNETNTVHTQINNVVTLQVESQETTEQHQDGGEIAADHVTAPSDPDSIAPGYGGHLKEADPERFNQVPRSYHSPWSQAIISDPALADTLVPRMPEPEPRPELPGYKSFNRVATPFGGFNRSPRPVSFKAPEAEPAPETVGLPEPPPGDAVLKRPTFNRVPQCWVPVEPPLILPAHPPLLDPTFIPESDDL